MDSRSSASYDGTSKRYAGVGRMTDRLYTGSGTILPFNPNSANLDILTTAQAIRRVAYSAAQLPLLAKLHNFPLPVDLGALCIGWRAQELDDWKQLRDKQLLTGLL
jgi:predicted DNA-binding transcriptional regulator AlpA